MYVAAALFPLNNLFVNAFQQEAGQRKSAFVLKRGFLNDRTDEIDISGLVQAYLFGERKIVAGGNVKNSFQQFVGIKGRQHARRNADDFFQQRLQLLPQFFVFGDVENAFAGSGAEKRTGGVNGKAVPKCLQRKASLHIWHPSCPHSMNVQE